MRSGTDNARLASSELKGPQAKALPEKQPQSSAAVSEPAAGSKDGLKERLAKQRARLLATNLKNSQQQKNAGMTTQKAGDEAKPAESKLPEAQKLKSKPPAPLHNSGASSQPPINVPKQWQQTSAQQNAASSSQQDPKNGAQIAEKETKPHFVPSASSAAHAVDITGLKVQAAESSALSSGSDHRSSPAGRRGDEIDTYANEDEGHEAAIPFGMSPAGGSGADFFGESKPSPRFSGAHAAAQSERVDNELPNTPPRIQFGSGSGNGQQKRVSLDQDTAFFDSDSPYGEEFFGRSREQAFAMPSEANEAHNGAAEMTNRHSGELASHFHPSSSGLSEPQQDFWESHEAPEFQQEAVHPDASSGSQPPETLPAHALSSASQIQIWPSHQPAVVSKQKSWRQAKGYEPQRESRDAAWRGSATQHWEQPIDDGRGFFADSPVAGTSHIQDSTEFGSDRNQPAAESQALVGKSPPTGAEAKFQGSQNMDAGERDQPSPFAAYDFQNRDTWQEEQQAQQWAPNGQSWEQHNYAEVNPIPPSASYYEPVQSAQPKDQWHGQEVSQNPRQRGEPAWSGAGSYPQHPGYSIAPTWSGQPSVHEQQWNQSQQHKRSSSSMRQAKPAEVARTCAQALSCPSGRPPVPLVAFGFGGRVAIMRPVPAAHFLANQDQMLALGPIQLLTTETLAATVSVPGHSQEAVLMSESAQLLSSFPGALTNSTNRNKDNPFFGQKKAIVRSSILGVLQVLEYIASREADAAATAEAGGETALLLIWRAIRLLSQNKGTFRSAPEQGGRGKAPKPALEKQLAQLLLADGGEPSSQHPGLTNGHLHSWGAEKLLADQASSAGVAEDAARQMQSLLEQGDQTAALKVAVEAQLWGPALLLARLQGESVFCKTATQMTGRALHRGTPLQMLLSSVVSQGQSSSQESGEDEPVQNWRGSLAILAANRGSGSDAAIVKLGDRLWTANGNVVQAHLCYIVAGVLPSAYESSARMCLPSGDHKSCPRTFASIEAIQMGLTLEWARMQGPGSTQGAAAMLPYRLILAAKLAEFGRVEAASQHCTAVTAALNAFGSRLPGGLLVVRSLVNELQLRLQNHAQAFNISISHSAGGSLMSKAGKWLDKGLSKLIGASELPDSVQDAAGGKPPNPPSHRRSASQPASPRTQMYRRVNSEGEMTVAGPPRPVTPQNIPIPSAPSSAAASPTPSMQSGSTHMEKAPSLSVRGLMGKVGSFTSLLGSAAAPPKKEADSSRENTLYYDNELKIWRQHGKPPPEPEAPLQPPPVSFSSAPSESGRSDGSGAGPPPQAGNPFLAAPPGGIRSRYVETIPTTSRPSSGGVVPKPPSAVGIIPRPPTFFTPPGAQRPATPTFFTPSTSGVRPQSWATPGRDGAPGASTDSRQGFPGQQRTPGLNPVQSGPSRQSSGALSSHDEGLTDVAL